MSGPTPEGVGLGQPRLPIYDGSLSDTHANPIEKQGAKNKTNPERHGRRWTAHAMAGQTGGLGRIWGGLAGERGCSGLRAFGIPRSARAKANIGCSKGVERRGEASGELSTAVWGNDARASMQQAVCGLQ